MKLNIEELARQAGFRAGRINSSSGESLLFIAPSSSTDCADQVAAPIHLVAAAVKEECAKLVLQVANDDAGNPYKQALRMGAAAIRAMEVKT